MKILKTLIVSIILLLVSVFLMSIIRYYERENTIAYNSENMTNTIYSNVNYKSDMVGSIPSTVEAIASIMQDIDDRVSWINERLNRKFYNDCYDGDTLVYRYVGYDFDLDSFTEYYLYYDKYGKLIYADITHYRSAQYFMYFHNDELLYVEVGPFVTGKLFINGDLAHVEAVIKEDASYSFVLQDLALCLENAYK